MASDPNANISFRVNKSAETPPDYISVRRVENGYILSETLPEMGHYPAREHVARSLDELSGLVVRVMGGGATAQTGEAKR